MEALRASNHTPSKQAFAHPHASILAHNGRKTNGVSAEKEALEAELDENASSENNAYRVRKLASEYSKLKAKNQELEALLAAERRKTEQLEGDLSETERTLNEKNDELETVTWNCERLKKRCSNLMDQVKRIHDEMKRRKTTTSWVGSLFVGNPNPKKHHGALVKRLEVAREELKSKIDENERLHMTMFDMQEEHKHVVETMQRKVEEMKFEMERRDRELADWHHKHEQLSTVVQNHNTKTEKRVNQLLTQIKQEQRKAQSERDRCTSLEHANAALTHSTQALQRRFAAKVRLDDECREAFNKRTLPVYDRGLVSAKARLLDDVADVLHKLRTHMFAMSKAVVSKLSREDPVYLRSQHPSEYNTLTGELQQLALRAATLPAELDGTFNAAATQVKRLAHGLQVHNQLNEEGNSSTRSFGKNKESLFLSLSSVLDCCSRLLFVQIDFLDYQRRLDQVSQSNAAQLSARAQNLIVRRRHTAILAESLETLHSQLQSASDCLHEIARFQNEEAMSFYCNWALDVLLAHAPVAMQNLRKSVLQVSSKYAHKCTADHKVSFISNAVRELNDSIVSELTVLNKLIQTLISKTVAYRDSVLAQSSTTAYRNMVKAILGHDQPAEAHPVVSVPDAAHPDLGHRVLSMLRGQVDVDLSGLRLMHTQTQSYINALRTDPQFPPKETAVPYAEALEQRRTLQVLHGEAAVLGGDLSGLCHGIDELQAILQQASDSPQVADFLRSVRKHSQPSTPNGASETPDQWNGVSPISHNDSLAGTGPDFPAVKLDFTENQPNQDASCDDGPQEQQGQQKQQEQAEEEAAIEEDTREELPLNDDAVSPKRLVIAKDLDASSPRSVDLDCKSHDHSLDVSYMASLQPEAPDKPTTVSSLESQGAAPQDTETVAI